MQIQLRATLVGKQDMRGTKNTPTHALLKLSAPTEQLTTEQLGLLAQYVGERVDVTIALSPFVGSGGRQATLDDALEEPRTNGSRRTPERVMPLPEERCAGCGDPIGEDPDRCFYTPIAGQPRPMHGHCADEWDRSRNGTLVTLWLGDASPVEVGVAVAAAVQEVLAAGEPEAPKSEPPPDGRAFTTDPPGTTATLTDPEAAAALAAFDALGPSPAASMPEPGPHLARIAAEAEAGLPGAKKPRRRATVPDEPVESPV